MIPIVSEQGAPAAARHEITAAPRDTRKAFGQMLATSRGQGKASAPGGGAPEDAPLAEADSAAPAAPDGAPEPDPAATAGPPAGVAGRNDPSNAGEERGAARPDAPTAPAERALTPAQSASRPQQAALLRESQHTAIVHAASDARGARPETIAPLTRVLPAHGRPAGQAAPVPDGKAAQPGQPSPLTLAQARIATTTARFDLLYRSWHDGGDPVARPADTPQAAQAMRHAFLAAAPARGSTEQLIPAARGLRAAHLAEAAPPGDRDSVGLGAGETSARLSGTGAPASPAPAGAAQGTPSPIAAQITQAIAAARGDTVQVILSPEELGRVRIQLQAGDTGLQLHISAERPETLELLRRHSPDLLRALAQDGFGTLDLHLRDEGDGPDWDRAAPRAASSAEPSVQTPTPGRTARPATAGMDLRV